MPAFDIRAATRLQQKENSQAVEQLSAKIPPLIQVDPETGRAKTSPDELRQLMREITPGRFGQALAESLLAYAGGGFVNLRSEVAGAPILVPWMAIEDISYLLGGCPASVRRTLGVGGRQRANRISQDLHERFPALAAEIFPPQTGLLLSHDPMWFAGRPIIDQVPEPPEPPPGAQDPPARPRPLQDAGNLILGYADTSDEVELFEVAKCILSGQFGPWWDGPSGYLFGFRVCFDRKCADRLATYLLKFWIPGPVSLLNALMSAVTTGVFVSAAGGAGVTAAIQAGTDSFVTVFSLYVALFTLELGINISEANVGNGVCVYFGWPGGLIPIFARSR